MISSLTRFINTSSFSISTLTERLTIGLPVAGLLLLPLAGAFDSFFSSFFSATAVSFFVSSGSFSNFSPIASLISDTFLITPRTFSRDSLEITHILKSKSNFSSSISCAGGLDLIISPTLSKFLNTKNALAAFKRHASSTNTVIVYTFIFFSNASSIACFSKSANTKSLYFSFFPSSAFFSGAVCVTVSSFFSVCGAPPFKIASNWFKIASLSLSPSSPVS